MCINIVWTRGLQMGFKKNITIALLVLLSTPTRLILLIVLTVPMREIVLMVLKVLIVVLVIIYSQY